MSTAIVEIRPAARMTVNEIAADLHLGKRAVLNLLANGQLPAIRMGSRWLVTRIAYERWKENCGMTSLMKSV
jgi:excisionase family DNA binding protein